MSVIKNLELAWQNDSFYVQTTSKKAASIFGSGVFGYMAGRISGATSPRDGAVLSVVHRVSDTFIKFIENRFVKDPFMSDADDEKTVRFLTRLVVSLILTNKMLSLANVRQLRLLPYIKLVFTEVVIECAFTKIAYAFFPSLQPRPS